MRRLLLVIAMLVSPVLGQPAEFVVHTRPSGASLSDQFGQYLGRSGETIHKELKDYGTKLELSIKLDGYRVERTIVLTSALTSSGRYPAEGEVVLQPNQIGTWIKSRPDVQMGVLGLAGLLVWAAAFSVRRFQRLRRMETRVARLKQFEAAEATDSLIMKTLAGYRLVELLGRGGNATVYRAIPDASLNEKEAVAVKVLRFGSADDPDFFKRFHRECQISRSLNHPGVVRLFDFGEEQGLPYLVLELIQGKSLRSRVREGGIPLGEMLTLMAPVFEGVAYAHALGIVHRDLKPENVLVTADGCAKVTDFGLARAEDSEKVTRTGMTLGTPAYMSPEQINGTVDYRTDEYALGIMVFELLSGICPFDDVDPVRIIFKHLTEEVPSLSATRPELRGRVEETVARMLAKDPYDRYPTVIEAWEALVACV